MHTCIVAWECACGLFIFMFVAMCTVFCTLCVFMHMTLYVCFSLCTCGVYVPTCAWICFLRNALFCCPGHCLLHNEGQIVEKGWLAFWWILPQTLHQSVLFRLPPSSVVFPSLEAAARIGRWAGLYCSVASPWQRPWFLTSKTRRAALLIHETKIAS